MSNEPQGVLTGLTHPVGRKPWFGLSMAGHFFRLVDGDRYLAVLPSDQSARLVDAILFEGNSTDPRQDMARLATTWANMHGLMRRER